MQKETLITTVEEKVSQLISASPEHFLVEVRVKPTNNIKVFIDGDNGIAISDLASYNRRLYKDLEENGFFPDGDFSLELSSPGLDEPLKKLRQYKKNIGRYVDITLQNGESKEGKMLEVTDDAILLETETGKGKKKEIKQELVLFTDIKTTKIQIKF